MQYSTPGKKLNPLIGNLTAPIYAKNPQRYRRLCLWVWTHQRLGWPDEAIAGAVQLAGENIHLADDWWKYLTSLLKKAKGRANEQESQKYKTEVGQIANEFLEFVKLRRDRRRVPV